VGLVVVVEMGLGVDGDNESEGSERRRLMHMSLWNASRETDR
jgi:hypothetical protein